MKGSDLKGNKGVKSTRLERNIIGTITPRAMCYECMRPCSHCLCSLIEPFEAHFNILILQHPHERRKYCSTSKLVAKGILNSKIIKGIVFDRCEVLNSFPASEVFLLYPGKNAVACENHPLKKNSTIVVIDGTWIEARKIMYRNEFLKFLPMISFSQPLQSHYKIRRQPKDHCLSTIECIGHLLRLSDQDTEQKFNRLFSGFAQMVEQQLSYFPRMRDKADTI